MTKDKKLLVDLIRAPDPTCIDDMSDEPQGLLYLAAVLKNAGYNTRVTNLAGHTEESWKPHIKEADIYGIQLYTPTAHHGINIAHFIKERYPGKPIICGGAHPTADPKDPRLNIFDKIVMGEGERSIVTIADAYRDGKDIPRVIQSEMIKDLDSLPFPAWDQVDMMGFTRKIDGKRCFGISGSRGCCYQCAFCDRSLFGSKVRFRSLENITKEMKEIIDTYGVRQFEFFDDMFTVSKKRLKQFADMTKGWNIAYRCNGRADVHDPEVYQLLKETGCKKICFGIESGSQKILDLMKKGTTVEQNLKAIKLSQAAGIPATGYFIVGFPGETKETIQQTIDFIKTSDIDQAQVYTFIPLPGGEVAKNPEKFGIVRMSKDYTDYFLVTGKDGHGGKVVDTKWLSADELQSELQRVRTFLRERKWRGDIPDYYKDKLGYKTSTTKQ
jgi:radical SAM superfamily enzyme YgiQ (UPF0313 family)